MKKISEKNLIILFLATIVFGISIISTLISTVSAATLSETTASLNIVSLKYEPYPVEPGQYFKLWIKVENSGVDTARDAAFEIQSEFPFSIDSNENPKREIGELRVGDEVVLEYKIKVDADAVEGKNDLKFRYTTNENTKDWFTRVLNVSVQTHDAVLSIKNVEAEPSTIAPGQTSHIKITLENTADSLLKDIRVNLNLYTAISTASSVTFIELPFTPIGSSNIKTLSSIDSHETKVVEFDLIADSDAKAKIYKLPINVMYSDETGKNYSRSYITALLVSSEPDLSMSVESTTLSKEQKSGTVVIKFVNKGTTDIKFMNVKLKPSSNYELISSDEVYVGSVDSDDYQTAEFKINLKKTPDVVNLPLEIEFKDGVNKEYSESVNVKLNLFTNKQLGKSNGSFLNTFIIIVIIAAVGYFAYKKFRKKKK